MSSASWAKARAPMMPALLPHAEGCREERGRGCSGEGSGSGKGIRCLDVAIDLVGGEARVLDVSVQAFRGGVG